MLRRIALFVVFVSVMATRTTLAQQHIPSSNEVTLDYYLPDDVSFNDDIPKPESVLGYPVGRWHVRHDQLVDYMYKLAGASDRVTIQQTGRTWEQRPLVLLTITSPDNQRNIDQIRRQHLQLTDPQQSKNLDTSEMPVVVYQGYSIHGDEPSGSNAALVAAYYLAAAEGARVEEMLDNTVVLLDPSLNPDGMNRFANWVNTNRHRTLVSDPQNREQNQPWPGGRTNHYWFDLNRDWLLLQHPASQARIQQFHRWKPNILTDHHEMGTNSTFFFQPGIPSRTHPLTPQRNQQLTSAIAEYHADKLDQNQRLYFSKEDYDDFYYGKGSTYPDINGSIGILFEQASSRSHEQESVQGVLKFPYTVKNQFLTMLSTLEAAQNLRVEILNYQRDFFRQSAGEAAGTQVKGYVFGSQDDPARTTQFVKLIKQHNISVYRLARDVTSEGYTFESRDSYVIPTNQKQFRLIQALFEKRTSFQDSLFYDVSAWTMPLAFNLPYSALDSRTFSNNLLGDEADGDLKQRRMIGGESRYGYVFEWDGYYAPRALNRLQQAGIKAMVASEPFTLVTGEGTFDLDYGSIMVPFQMQKVPDEKITRLMRTITEEDDIDVYAAASGLTPKGIDLGSRSFEPLHHPKVMLLVGSGVSSYEAGEVWHLLDARYHMPISLVDKSALDHTNLDRYNTIVMVNGRYNDLSAEFVDMLGHWIEQGGTLITTKYATRWAAEQKLAPITFVEEEEQKGGYKSYSRLDRNKGAHYIGGTIFWNELDLSNPLGYGYNSRLIPVFRNSTLFMNPSKNRYATPLRYTDDPLASGYIHPDDLDQLKSSAGIVVSGKGRGRVISFADNPNFRAFWYGTNKLFMNAIYFGHTIDGDAAGR